MCGDTMQTVTLGFLSLSGPPGILAMRRKLLAVAQRLGLSSSKSIRLAAAASDYAKEAVQSGTLQMQIGLTAADTAPELFVDFLTANSSTDNFLRLGFDRVEALIDGK